MWGSARLPRSSPPGCGSAADLRGDGAAPMVPKIRAHHLCHEIRAMGMRRAKSLARQSQGRATSLLDPQPCVPGGGCSSSGAGRGAGGTWGRWQSRALQQVLVSVRPAEPAP